MLELFETFELVFETTPLVGHRDVLYKLRDTAFAFDNESLVVVVSVERIVSCKQVLLGRPGA